MPIVYGLPGPDLFEAAERGEVRLGGCIMPSGPTCPLCRSALSASDRGRRREGRSEDLPSTVLLGLALEGDAAASAELLRRLRGSGGAVDGTASERV